MANSRIYVQESIADKFIGKFKELFAGTKSGSALESGMNMGPQADKIQFDNVMRYIEEGKKSGGQLILGGERFGDKGYFVQPTIFAKVPEDHKIAKEEIFGPVVIINTFTSERDVIDRANDSDLGLYAAVFTKDISRATRVAKRLQAGSVGINTTSPNVGGPDVPFGGFKSSGIGREAGIAALSQYLEVKAVTMVYEDEIPN